MYADSFYTDLGKKLRACRNAKGLTLGQVSAAIGKSIGTLSKYEKGEIAIDLKVLTELCTLFNVDLSTVLPATKKEPDSAHLERYASDLVDLLYLYWYKAGENTLYVSAIENNNIDRTSTLYFDLQDTQDIYSSRFVYTGNVTYSDFHIDYHFKNISAPYDSLSLTVPTFSKQPYRIGLLMTITFYSQAVAIKCLASTTPITDQELLLRTLTVTPEEIKTLRATNFFTV